MSRCLPENGRQIFLLGNAAKTDFRKNSSGRLLRNHLHFRDIARELETGNAESLDLALNGKSWSQFRSGK